MTTYTTDHQNKVAEMHRAFGHPVNLTPSATPTGFTDEDRRIAKLRIDLIQEELNELAEAIEDYDIIEIADALADLQVVIDGAACVYGVDIGMAFDEVMRSNMTKLDEDGLPVPHPTVPGKFGKSHLYEKPDIAKVLSAQITAARA